MIEWHTPENEVRLNNQLRRNMVTGSVIVMCLLETVLLSEYREAGGPNDLALVLMLGLCAMLVLLMGHGRSIEPTRYRLCDEGVQIATKTYPWRHFAHAHLVEGKNGGPMKLTLAGTGLFGDLVIPVDEDSVDHNQVIAYALYQLKMSPRLRLGKVG
jgi:hypothetical protein